MDFSERKKGNNYYLILTSSTSAAAWSVASANAHESTAGERASAGKAAEVAADEEEIEANNVVAGIIALGAMLPRRMTFEAFSFAGAFKR